MKYYFNLIFKGINRAIQNFGIHPLVGLLLISTEFIGDRLKSIDF